MTRKLAVHRSWRAPTWRDGAGVAAGTSTTLWYFGLLDALKPSQKPLLWGEGARGAGEGASPNAYQDSTIW